MGDNCPTRLKVQLKQPKFWLHLKQPDLFLSLKNLPFFAQLLKFDFKELLGTAIKRVMVVSFLGIRKSP